MDVSTRKLRYFVAVAEELHFSRAAARLYVAQQALSKQVRELEQDLGVELLHRTTRTVELTPAGEVFLETARDLLTRLDAGVLAAQRTGRRAAGALRLGFMIGAALELTAPIISQYAERFPGVRLDLREYGFADPSAGLADDSSDVALIRAPIQAKGIDFEPLFVEPLVLMVPAGHRFATRARVGVPEILAEPLAIGRSNDQVWRSFWTLEDYRDGVPAKVVRETSSQTEELEIVASGLACSVTCASAARYTQHPRVRYLPIDGVPGSALTIGWRHRTPLVDDFLATARAVRAAEPELVAAIEQPF
ncbi:LysR substrate-binding domain-containing protein [Kribbella deserti]|uniref:LysR substrate-binding domain-containing protein n=1 Tax=Kribbella deserti TaxID=1926257 RepID=A0ABV6QHB2_9ACTN